MVASEPFWIAQEVSDHTPEDQFDTPTRNADLMDTGNLSVREIRALLASLDVPDPYLFIRLTRDPRATVRRLGYGALRHRRNLAANEDIFRSDEVRYLAGADEAGRGALAGPLAAAAVMFAPDVVVKGINDSKLLTPARREELYEQIIESAESVSVAFMDPGLIDRWGIQPVNMKALGDALSGIDERCQCAICDHFSLAGRPVPTYGVPKADETFQSVAAASIVAKVERDRVMKSLHSRFPRYNFKENKGYATEEHMAALTDYGPCVVHRLTFSGVLPEREVSLWEGPSAEGRS
jgi:ribonuclease HII